MRSFTKKTTTREVTLSDGDEQIKLTVTRPALLFIDGLNRAFPLDESGTAAANYRNAMRSVIIAAEGIRPTEDLPDRPGFAALEPEWQKYAESLYELFNDAGFSKAHVSELFIACLELVSETHTQASKEQMAESGNG